MWNEPNEEELKRMPALYATENTPLEEKIIQMHFFLSSCDWFVAEYGQADRLFFGYAILNNDLDNSEWGYFSYDELQSINIHGIEIDRDLHWKSQKVCEIEKIIAAYEHQGRKL